MTPIHLVSLVGDPSRYEEVTHHWPERPDASRPPGWTKYTVEALRHFLGLEENQITLVGTEHALQDVRPHLPSLDERECPNGETFAEQQTFVARLRDLLDQLRVDGVTEVYLDVTHGFRAQSLLAVGAASFVRAEWRREGHTSTPAIRVLYGGLDKDEGTTTFWDLTDLLTLGDWSAALDALNRFGRADDLARLALAESGPGAETGAERGFRRSLADEAKAYADDLVFNRWADLLFGRKGGAGSAARLRGVLDGAEPFLARRTPLRAAFAAMGNALEGLDAPNVYSKDGLRAARRLAHTYARLQRYLELAALIRETLVTASVVQAGTTLPEPGRPGAHTGRMGWEKAIQADPPQAVPPPDPATLDLFEKAGDRRNDMLHGGLNANPQRAKRLRTLLVGDAEPPAANTFLHRFDTLLAKITDP